MIKYSTDLQDFKLVVSCYIGKGEESIRASIHASWDNPREHSRTRYAPSLVPGDEQPPVKRNYVLRNEIIGYLSFGELTSTVDIPSK